MVGTILSLRCVLNVNGDGGGSVAMSGHSECDKAHIAIAAACTANGRLSPKSDDANDDLTCSCQ